MALRLLAFEWVNVSNSLNTGRTSGDMAAASCSALGGLVSNYRLVLSM
jgi:hypothetical protein